MWHGIRHFQFSGWQLDEKDDLRRIVRFMPFRCWVFLSLDFVAHFPVQLTSDPKNAFDFLLTPKTNLAHLRRMNSRWCVMYQRIVQWLWMLDSNWVPNVLHCPLDDMSCALNAAHSEVWHFESCVYFDWCSYCCWWRFVAVDLVRYSDGFHVDRVMLPDLSLSVILSRLIWWFYFSNRARATENYREKNWN